MFLEIKQLLTSFFYFEYISQLMYDVHNNLVPENTLLCSRK